MPVAYGVLSVVLVAVVVAVAYGSQAPLLAVADFAPAAQREIAAPPTTGDERSAVGRSSPSRWSTTTTPAVAPTGSTAPAGASAPTTVAPRGRHCFGDPPRQLPDPRSPSCQPTIFEGANGGATAPGVTATEVRVAVTGVSKGSSAEGRSLTYRKWSTLFEYANRYFDFYGRRLVPVFVDFDGEQRDPVAARAMAAEMKAQGVFAAVNVGNYGVHPAWFQDLARQGIVTISSGAWELLSDREMFDPWHPYLWSVYPSLEDTWRNLADFVCTSLAGRPASHAAPALQTTTRKFGVFAVGRNRVPWLRPLVEGLDACGAAPKVVEIASGSANYDQVLRTGVEAFKAAGVTSVICACADYFGGSVLNTVTRGAGWTDPEILGPIFYPEARQEWVVQVDIAPAARPHLFGLQPFTKVAPVQAQWWMGGALEVDPGAVTALDGRELAPLYEQLLVLASGVQSAGPALTPHTFAAGLTAAAFPNTGAGQAPYWQPSVGFGPGDHSFYDDYALVWWNEQAEAFGGQAAPQGSWCYLDQGARHATGRYPRDADARFFDASAPCR